MMSSLFFYYDQQEESPIPILLTYYKHLGMWLNHTININGREVLFPNYSHIMVHVEG